MSRSPSDVLAWVVRTAPLENELLSSWLVRTATAHGQTLHRFGVDRLAIRNITRMDLDLRASPALIECITRESGLSQDRVEAMTLLPWETRMGQSARGAGVMPWILPRGIPARALYRHGQQACIQCLTEGTGYLREWRLAFAVSCAQHSRWLVDACPRCDAPFDPMRVVKTPVECHRCTIRMAHAAKPHGPFFSRAVQIEQWLLRALQGSGFVRIREEHVRLDDAMRGFLYLLRLDKRLSRTPHRMLPIATLRTPQRIERIERLAKILDDWPDQILERAVCADIPRTPFYSEACPAWVLAPLASLRDVRMRASRRPSVEDTVLEELRRRQPTNWRSRHAHRLVRLMRESS